MLKARSMAEASLLTGLSVVLYLAASFIPLVGFFLVFLSPIPLVILEMRHDLKTGIVALTVGTVLTMLITGPIPAISYALGFGILALALGRIIELRRSAIEILICGSIVSLICKLMLAVLLYAVTGLNPFALDVEGMNKIMDWALSLNGSNAEAIKAQFETAITVIPLLVPTILIMTAVCDSFLCYWLSRKVVERVEHVALPALPPFNCWRFPTSCLGAYIAGMICSLLAAKYPQYGIFARVGLNVSLIVSYIFMIQGFSLCAWVLDRKGFDKRLRSVLLVIAFFIPILTQIALYIGIVDMCWNTRKRVEQRR